MGSLKPSNASLFVQEEYPDLTLYRVGDFPRFACPDDLSSAPYVRECHQPFAYVIHYRQTGEFLLARDHLGIEPLYYSLQGENLIFASNLPDLIRACPSPPVVDEEALRNCYLPLSEYRDETHLSGVFRVEPGHFLKVSPQGKVTKTAYWKLDRQAPYLRYRRDEDYLDHLSFLMKESLHENCRGHDQIAAEFSAGIDSAAVITTSVRLGIEPPLYLHDALPGTLADQVYNRKYEEAFLAHFPQLRITRVRAENFEPLKVLSSQAQLFAGHASYVFPFFAEPVHRAVAADKNSILLSGFGGDQGFSGHAPASLIPISWPRKVWREARRRIRQAPKPKLSPLLSQFDVTSLRSLEWDMLQGPHSHEIRMRIENSSTVTKPLGFTYRYPLLYPKLLEFYLSVPPEQKRSGHRGRWLARRYLARELNSPLFHDYGKREGLFIMPAAVDSFRQKMQNGEFGDRFSKLPILEKMPPAASEELRFLHAVRGFVFHAYYS